MSKKRKIAVNARFLLKGKLEGIGTYSHEILQRLVHLMPDIQFDFIFDRTYDPSFIYGENVKPHIIGPPARHPFLWYWWFEHSLNSWLNKNKPDVLFSPDSFISLKNKTKSLLVMHDIAFEHFDTHHSNLVKKYYRYYFPKYAKHASHIISVSDYTKQDIIASYKINPEKFTLAPCSVSSAYWALPESRIKEIKQDLTQNAPFFLCVGSINPRKNMKGVVKAFEKLKKENALEHKLVIVGAKGWKTQEFDSILESTSIKKDIILTGHLIPERLNEIMNAAETLVFPSFFEGFGIPIVEAFKTNTPVITSNVSSMPEIAGDAAILVDPSSVEEIANAMFSILDQDKRSQMIAKGKERLHDYSWDKSAEIIAKELYRLIGE